MVTIFEQHDFILKTNAMRHVAELIRRFQDKIDKQRDYIRSLFIEMERVGLHELLNQDYKRTGGIIHRQRRVRFTPTTPSKSPSPVLRPPTPYPRSTSSSSSPCPIALRYSPTTSQYSPTASQYGTPPESPTFIPEILFLNPDIVSSQETQEELEQQIEKQMESLRTIRVNWLTYQGGIGSRFNPIIIEDD